MIGDGRGLRVSTVLTTGAATALLAFLALRWWVGQGNPLPASSLTVAALMAVLGCAELLVALRIRRGVAGTSKRPLDALWTHRMLLIGQAAALTGGVVAGWYLAVAGVVYPDLDAESVRRVAWAALALAGGGVVLSVGGFAIQAACRIDPPDADEPDWGDGRNGWADHPQVPEG